MSFTGGLPFRTFVSTAVSTFGRSVALALGLAFFAFARNAGASDCRPSATTPHVPRREPAMREAQELGRVKRYADARALYLWLLARTPSDSETRKSLARIDAWDGCWDQSEREFREVLAAHTDDTEARAGLVDLFMWEKRWVAAEDLLADGLRADPDSSALLLRRARLLHWSGAEGEAAGIVRDLERREPDDEEIKALGDEVFQGQTTLGFRFDAYPGGYPNIYTLDSQLLERWRRFEFAFDSHLVDWSGGGLATPIVDGERSLRVAYRPAPGFTAALEAGFGNPGVVVPRAELGAEIAFPIVGRFSGILDYAYWAFAGGVSVHIFNPSVAYEVSDEVEVALHAWIVHVGVGPTNSSGFAETGGAHIGWKQSARLRWALYYTYGVQLDRDPTFVELFDLRSHVVTGAVDWLVERGWGIRGLLGLERRSQDGVPSIFIESLGAAAYVRW